MDTGTIVAIVTASASALSTVSTIIWAVSRSKTIMDSNAERIAESISELKDTVKNVVQTQTDHTVRISILETVTKLDRHDCADPDCTKR